MSGERLRRRNHFVPVRYLSRFTHDGSPEGLLWVHDRRGLPSRQVPPRATGYERNLYVTDAGDWFERWLADQVDKWGAKLLEELLAPALPATHAARREHPLVQPAKRFRLSVYLLLQQLRVPGSRAEASALASRVITKLASGEEVTLFEVPGSGSPSDEVTGWMFETPIAKLVDELRAGRLPTSEVTWHWVAGMPLFASTYARMLMTAPFRLVNAPSGHEFITSDAPVVTSFSGGRLPHEDPPVGMRLSGVWTSADAVTYFPLSPERMLVVRPAPRDKSPADAAAWCESLNALIARRADRFFYARAQRDDLLAPPDA